MKRHYEINYTFPYSILPPLHQEDKTKWLSQISGILTSSNFTQLPPTASIFCENKSHTKSKCFTFFQISRKNVKRRAHDFSSFIVCPLYSQNFSLEIAKPLSAF